MYDVKNLGRLRTKIFALSIQFNILQYDVALKIESETLGI